MLGCSMPHTLGQIVPFVKDNMSPDCAPRWRHNLGMKESPTELEFRSALQGRMVELRNKLGWSQETMAKALGVPFERYKKYETRSPLPVYLIPTFAQLTSCDVDYLLLGKVKARPKKAVDDSHMRAPEGAIPLERGARTSIEKPRDRKTA